MIFPFLFAMINKKEAEIKYLSIHFMGSPHEGIDSVFLPSPPELQEGKLKQALISFFLDNFTEPLFYKFAPVADSLEENTMFQATTACFEDDSFFHDWSLQVAKWLESQSKNHFIKPGELLIGKIDGILLHDEFFDAIAIFKIESQEPFFHFIKDKNGFDVSVEEGASIKKLDKACLILNKDRENGYTILNVDQSNRNKEAKYWKEDFLHIESLADDYHNTKQFIQLTKEFVHDRLPKQFDMDKSQQAQTMQRSLDYFQKQESFETEEYATKVFKDEKVVDAFREFKDDYESYRQVELINQFDISDQAVKKQSRVFKSVIKLDKNFHIYVHGNKNMIQKGTDDEGRKYYILYYDEEN